MASGRDAYHSADYGERSRKIQEGSAGTSAHIAPASNSATVEPSVSVPTRERPRDASSARALLPIHRRVNGQHALSVAPYVAKRSAVRLDGSPTPRERPCMTRQGVDPGSAAAASSCRKRRSGWFGFRITMWASTPLRTDGIMVSMKVYLCARLWSWSCATWIHHAARLVR